MARDLDHMYVGDMTLPELVTHMKDVRHDIEQRRKTADDEGRIHFSEKEAREDQANLHRLADIRDELYVRRQDEQQAAGQVEDVDEDALADRLQMFDQAMRSKTIDSATGRPVELRSLFREAETRALRGEGFRFGLGHFAEILERSTTTSNAGAVHSVAAGAGGGGIWLPRESGGTNLELRPGTRLDAGVWPANSATGATAEGGTKPTLDPSSLGTDTVSPYAVTSNVTIQSEAAGRGVEQFTWAGTRKVRRSVNDAFTTAMVTAGGTARAFDTDVVTSVDGAISDMMAVAATVPSLVIVDPAHFSALATAGGDDATDAFPAFRGVRLVSSAVAGLADHALIIDGSAITYSMSGVEVRTQPQVITNSTDVVVEVWFAAVAYGASGVFLQDLTSA